MKPLLLFFFLNIGCASAYAQSNGEDSLAYRYYRQGDYTKTLSTIQNLLNQTKKGTDNTYFELYFNTLIKVKRYDDAEKLVKNLIDKEPANTDYYIALGKLYQEKGDIKESGKIFSQLISKLPKDEFKIRELANSFYKYGNYDLAMLTFQKGRKLLANDQLFVYELLSIYRFKKDKNRLVNEYLEAFNTMPQLLVQAEKVLPSVLEDKNDYFLLETALLKKMEKNPADSTYSQLLVWQYIQQQDYEKALSYLISQDRKFGSDGREVYNNARIFSANGASLTAIRAYEYILSKEKDNPYYLRAKIELISTKYDRWSSNRQDVQIPGKLANDYRSVITSYGKNKNTISAIKQLAELEAYHLNQPKKAEAALEEALLIPGLTDHEIGQIKLDLGDIYALTLQPWDAILAYEQVARQFEGQPLGTDALFRSAKLSFYQGNFRYAKSLADKLKTSTSQLLANDALNLSLTISDNLQSATDSSALKMYAEAEFLQFRNLPEKAINKLDSINLAWPQNSLADGILMSKAKIYINAGNFKQASQALTQLLELHDNSIWIDDALFMLADLYEKKLNQPGLAKACFQKLISDFPGSMYAAEARKRLRN